MEQQEKKMRETLEHFGITDEITEEGFWLANNTASVRQRLGIGVFPEERRKIRIITDYDPDYPTIVRRVIPV